MLRDVKLSSIMLSFLDKMVSLRMARFQGGFSFLCEFLSFLKLFLKIC